MSEINKGRGRGHPRNNVNNQNQKLGEDKFRKAQEELRAAVEKHIENNEYESSSEEEELESEAILTSVYKNYSQINSGVDGVEKSRQFLENTFQSGSVVCLICIASIKRADPIWNCSVCYGYFHLICIQRWAIDSIYQQNLAQEDLPRFRRAEKINWACPKCRQEYEQSEIPKRYFCFCGKAEDPPHHPWLIPHSCGDTCNKALNPECGHYCLLLCHPGPCPPCPKTVQSYCHCGKQGPKHQRCSQKYWSCNKKCGKPLLCKKHLCEETCHTGQCPPCHKESIQKCNCGSEKRNQPCFSPNWQCKKVCGKPFSCGQHVCTLVCHEGDCGDCLLSKERTCPCGKTAYVLPCTEDVPTCNDTCDKVLDCGTHRCSQKCHKGDCGMCLEQVTKICRCGLHKKELPCQKDFFCETKCKQMRNCLRHPCNRKCCDLMCPPCEKPCGRTLKCGYHKCPSICHRGQCYPCPQTVQIKCRCGSTVTTVPCGRQKRTPPPKCNKPCTIAPYCHHPVSEPHSCHFGNCKACRQICGKKRETCPHTCSATCHSAVLVKVKEDHAPAGPWEVVEAKTKRCDLPCPDCKVKVFVTCLGGHVTHDLLCYVARPFSCGRPCGRLLKCGNHKCEKECHVVTGAGDGVQAGENCMECESGCEKERAPGCTHPCPEPCHPGPCPPCNLNCKLKCHCGISLLYLRCGEINTCDEETKARLLSCQNKCPKNYPCGHSCESDCHPGDCPNPNDCRKKVKVRCECGRLKKEIGCDVVRNSGIRTVDCDDVCARKKEEKLQAQQRELEKKKMEEEKRNREEIERFKNKFQGRKKQREQNPVPETKKQTSLLSPGRIVILSVATGVAATLIFLLYKWDAL